MEEIFNKLTEDEIVTLMDNNLWPISMWNNIPEKYIGIIDKIKINHEWARDVGYSMLRSIDYIQNYTKLTKFQQALCMKVMDYDNSTFEEVLNKYLQTNSNESKLLLQDTITKYGINPLTRYSREFEIIILCTVYGNDLHFYSQTHEHVLISKIVKYINDGIEVEPLYQLLPTGFKFNIPIIIELNKFDIKNSPTVYDFEYHSTPILSNLIQNLNKFKRIGILINGYKSNSPSVDKIILPHLNSLGFISENFPDKDILIPHNVGKRDKFMTDVLQNIIDNKISEPVKLLDYDFSEAQQFISDVSPSRLSNYHHSGYYFEYKSVDFVLVHDSYYTPYFIAVRKIDLNPVLIEANKTGKDHAAYVFYTCNELGVRLGIRQFNAPSNILSRVDMQIDYKVNYFDNIVEYVVNEIKNNPPKWL